MAAVPDLRVRTVDHQWSQSTRDTRLCVLGVLSILYARGPNIGHQHSVNWIIVSAAHEACMCVHLAVELAAYLWTTPGLISGFCWHYDQPRCRR